MTGVLQKSLLQLQIIKEGRTDKLVNEIKAIDQYQLSLMTPKNFDSQDPENLVSKMEKAFESVCAALESNGVVNPKKLTVFEFYSRVYFFEKKIKPKTKFNGDNSEGNY
jgi:hypothetical protein